MENNNIVYALYRVSTKKQVDVNSDDIPMQREACEKFAALNGWTIAKDFCEKGVSGFKVRAEKRDVIQDLKSAALKGEFNILLCFMFDRLGRIDDETPFVVEWFVKNGVRVISVCEGEQKFENHVDKLLNYVRFWQASGESEKTSMRIKERMEQLTREGYFTGGHTLLGYTLVKNGRLNKKGDEVFDLAIIPAEAEIVRDMFHKTVKEGYGSDRLATYLNKQGIKTHGGAKFQSNSVIRILRCKLYTGYRVSGEAVSPFQEDLRIIDEDLYNQAQFILDQRAEKRAEKRQIAMSTKSKSLLSGIIFCGHCGGRLTANTNRDSYTRKDGTVTNYNSPRYICYHKSRKLCNCDGQATYLSIHVDNAINDIVAEVFSKIKNAPDNEMLKRRLEKDLASYKARQTKINTELSKYNKQLDKLQLEIADSLTGDSPYSPAQLSTAINTVDERIADANYRLEQLQNEMEHKKATVDTIAPAYERFTSWADEYAQAPVERQKMILGQLFSRIEIGKGYNLNVEINADYEQFCDNQKPSSVVA